MIREGEEPVVVVAEVVEAEVVQRVAEAEMTACQAEVDDAAVALGTRRPISREAEML